MDRLSESYIKSLVSSEVFDRGQRYFGQGRVVSCSYNRNTYYAQVRGSEMYEVSIWQERGEWMGSCNCPYDFEEYCKHIVAVMLAIRNSSDSIVSLFSRKKSVKPIEKVISHLDEKASHELLLDLTNHFPQVEERIRILAGDESGNKSLEDYKKIVRLTIPSFVDYYHTRAALHGADEVEDLAHILEEKDRVTDSLTAYQAVFEVLIDKLDSVDDSDGNFGDHIRFAFQEWVRLVTKLPKFSNRQDYIDYVFEQFGVESWENFSFTEELIEELVRQMGDKKDLAYILEKLDREFVDYPFESVGAINFKGSFYINKRLLLLDKLEKQQEYMRFAKQHLSDPQALLAFINKLISKKEYKEALETAEEYFEKTPGFYQIELGKMLLSLYKHFKNLDKEKQLLLRLFFEDRHEGFAFYQQLKEICLKDKTWVEWRNRIIASLKKENDIYRLIPVHLEEHMKEELISIAEESTDGYILEQVAKGLVKEDPAASFRIYQKLVKNYLPYKTGRGYYQIVGKWLKQMKTLGRKQEFESFIDSLRNNYQNRPAFLEEIADL